MTATPMDAAAWKGRAQAAACALLLVLLVLLARPFAEVGMVDEWSYAFSAKVLAQTGHVAYNGWGAMPLTWILYWGAALIRVFGFSFAVLRWGMLVVSAVTVFATHRVLQRSGLSAGYSTLGTLSLALAPSFYSNAPLFMSDVPGFLALVLCFYGVLRALRSPEAATGWLLFATVANTAVGSCRQIALLGVLVLVPCAWWNLRRSVRLSVLAPVWLACVGAIAALLRWFARQPYTVHEPLLPKGLSAHMLTQFVHVPLGLIFYLLPVAVAFVARLRWSDRTVRVVLGAAAVLLVAAAPLVPRPGFGLLKMPFLFDTLTLGGFHDVDNLVGVHVREFGPVWQASLTCLTWFLLAGMVLYVARPALRSASSGVAEAKLPDGVLLAIFAPFSVVYFALYATRTYPFDRYLLPLMLLTVMMALRALQRSSRLVSRLPWIVGAMIFLAAFDVLALHDVFARYRARVDGIAALQAQGIPRDQIDGAFEFDGWTELERTGYVRWPGIRLPSGEVVGAPPQQPRSACENWFVPFTPSVTPRYTVARSIYNCMEPLGAPIPYSTWFSPGERTLMTGRIHADQ